MFNFIIGERGVGKTYGAIKFCINDYLKNGNQFVYLRRFKTEIESSADAKDNSFFAKIIENEEFPDHEFKTQAKKDKAIFRCDKEICGYAIPLSTSLILKSKSFSKVKTIIFDEFIIERGTYHYLQNEVHQFLDFCETVMRLHDFRVFFLGNAIQKANPYFNYFNLDIPYGSDIKTFQNGLILVNYIKNLEYRAAKRKSRFGRLIDGTEYGSYAIDNKFLHENQTFIEKHDGHAKFYFILKVNGLNIGVWSSTLNGKIYFSNKYDNKCPIIYTTSTEDHNENTTLIRARNSTFMLTIIEKYRQGLVCFENQMIKSQVLPVLNKYCN